MNVARFFKKGGHVPMESNEVVQTSRRKVLTAGSILAGVAALGPPMTAQAHCNENLTYDIACDGRTLRFVRMDPAATDQWVARGDAFIVNGKIFPGGTIEQGLSGPEQAGSIGTWICRGWIYVEDLTDPDQVPHAATTQHYLFDDGSGLVSDGLEGGMKTARAIVGGFGSWAGASGYVFQEMVAENDTLLDLGGAEVPAPNFRFVFSLTSGN